MSFLPILPRERAQRAKPPVNPHQTPHMLSPANLSTSGGGAPGSGAPGSGAPGYGRTWVHL